MPRYFFNVHLGETIISDPEGQGFPDADAAWEATRAMAQDLMATEFSKPVNWATSHIEVKDEAGETVLEFPFLEAIQFTQQPH
ncbi:DUF6894 family protein [Microvirga puerhi]|uniref:DUF6894 domain-containing protein n=1 Tax=Microvirga puerhi TaxID=2876078 RepID=A0ABS7VNH4_9HYPH|nr:hypothetical protein [Microvirga puerhi]MBZ6077103.1 hypothetical protein [Microvirga puerhi]